MRGDHLLSTNQSSPDVVGVEGGVDEDSVVEEDAPGQHHADQVYIQSPATGLHWLWGSGLHAEVLHHVVIAQHTEY